MPIRGKKGVNDENNQGVRDEKASIKSPFKE